MSLVVKKNYNFGLFLLEKKSDFGGGKGRGYWVYIVLRLLA